MHITSLKSYHENEVIKQLHLLCDQFELKLEIIKRKTI